MNIINTKPKPFQKTTSSIWTDPYIQNNLLNAHLDASSDAASRKEESIKIIVDFVDKQIKRNSRLLDLGCGPGLYANQFTEKGHTAIGVDLNKKAIEYARKSNENIEYIEADYIQNFPQGKYDAIIMIYCDMGTHSDNDRDTLLRNCYESLEIGGKLIFDVFSDKIVEDKKEGSSWEYEANGGFWAKEEHLILSQTFHYPQNRAFAYQYNLIQKEASNHFIIWDRYFKEDEIIAILKNIGFGSITIKNNLLESNNFTSDSEIFVVAEK